jgi:uncharacterized protein (TIGR00251 family)
LSVFRFSGGAILLDVRVTTGAPKDECAGVWTGTENQQRLSLRVTAPPDKGRANAAVCALAAELLGVPKSRVSLATGDKDRLKTLRIEGETTEIEKRLAMLLRLTRRP